MKRVKELERSSQIQIKSEEGKEDRPVSGRVSSSPDIFISDVANDLEKVRGRVSKLENLIQEVDGKLDNTTGQIDEQIQELQDIVADIPGQFSTVPEKTPSRMNASEKYGMDHFPRANVLQVGSHQGGSKTLVANRSGILALSKQPSSVLLEEQESKQSLAGRASDTSLTLAFNPDGTLVSDPSNVAQGSASAGSRRKSPLVSTSMPHVNKAGQELATTTSGLPGGVTATTSPMPTGAQSAHQPPIDIHSATPRDVHSAGGSRQPSAGPRSSLGPQVVVDQASSPVNGRQSARISPAAGPSTDQSGKPVITGYNADGTPQYRSGDESGFVEDLTTSNDEAGGGQESRGRRGHHRSRNKFSRINYRKPGAGQTFGRDGNQDPSAPSTVGDNDGEMVDRETFEAFVRGNDEEIMGLKQKIETLRLGISLIESQGKLKALDHRLSDTMEVLQTAQAVQPNNQVGVPRPR